MRTKPPDKNRKERGAHRRDEVSGNQEDGASNGSSARRAKARTGAVAHEVHEGKLIKKPATEGGT